MSSLKTVHFKCTNTYVENKIDKCFTAVAFKASVFEIRSLVLKNTRNIFFLLVTICIIATDAAI